MSANQMVPSARQALQVLPVHQDREDRKDPGDEEDRKEGLETKVIEVLWDPLGKVANKALRGPMGWQGKTGSKGQKGDIGATGMPGAKGKPGESISAPSVTVSPPRLIVNESGSAFIHCSASGNPEPAVVWNKLDNRSEISQSAVSRGKLFLKNVKANDSGTYQCSATNILGQARAVAQLTVNGE